MLEESKKKYAVIPRTAEIKALDIFDAKIKDGFLEDADCIVTQLLFRCRFGITIIVVRTVASQNSGHEVVGTFEDVGCDFIALEVTLEIIDPFLKFFKPYF
jgi:hypothetical protein